MHARALRRARVYRRPIETMIWRYALGRGTYPTVIRLRPRRSSPAEVEIRSHFDLLTVQEIFLWECYPCRGDEKVIVDLGANIGVSMVFFLMHAPGAFVVGVEPIDDNIAYARVNLARFAGRFELVHAAAMDYDGSVEFGIETSGRYCGIGLHDGSRLTLTCVDVNELVRRTSAEHGRIDLIKIDIEGAEGPVLRGMSERSLASIERIAVEGTDIPFERLTRLGFRYQRHPSGVHWFDRAAAG